MSKLDEALIHHQAKRMVKLLILELLIEAMQAKTDEDYTELREKVEAL